MVIKEQSEPLLTVSEVAKLLHVHENTVRRWSDRGIIRAYRICSRGDRRFRKDDISLFLTGLQSFSGDERRASRANI